MNEINRITLDGKTYSVGVPPDSIFYAGDSWDRSVEYAVEPAISAYADGITFHCDGNNIKIGDTTLTNTINENSTVTYAVDTANSAVNKIDSLESNISYIQADTYNLYDKVKELDEKIDALSLVVGQRKVGRAFASLVDKIKQSPQRDKGKIILSDLIEPGEAAWIEKMDLKTRHTGTFKKSRLLTV